MLRYTRFLPLAVVLAGAAACDDAGITSPLQETAPPGTGTQFSEQISLPALQQQTSTGAARVEVKLRADGDALVAREIEHEEEALGEPERIESSVTAVAADRLTLALGGLQVTFDATTRFLSEGESELTSEEFITRLQTALDAGRKPAVEARRAAPAAPQAPEDGSFLATELEIDDEASQPKLSLNIDADNLVVSATDTSTATLKVLGLTIEVRAKETELQSRRPGKRGKAKFEGVVSAVDVALRTVTLLDGRVIRIVDGTEIEDDGLQTLEEVDAAVKAGQIVEAEGKGILESSEPVTIVAVEAEFEVEDDADDVPASGRLEGQVAAVDTVARTITLASGELIRVVDATKLRGNKGISSLREVAAALTALRTVSLKSRTLLESAGPPPVHIALDVIFKSDGTGEDNGKGKGKGNGNGGGDGSDGAEFESGVKAADATAGTFTLADDRVIKVTDSTVVDAEGDLKTLQEVADAIAAGLAVEAEGEAVLEGGVLVATKVKFETDADDDGEGDDDGDADEVEAEGVVESADVAAGTFKIKDGRTVRLTADTQVSSDGDLTTLQQVLDALAAGTPVTAEATGVLDGEVLVATTVKFETD